MEIKLKVKRGKQTLIILIPHNATLLQLKIEIQAMVNETGGLGSLEDGDDQMGNAGEELEEIEIPKPAFNDDSSDESDDELAKKAKKFGKSSLQGPKQEQTKHESDSEMEIDHDPEENSHKIASTDDIKIGKPVNSADATGTNFTDLEHILGAKKIDNQPLSKLEIADGDVIAFAVINEDFLVVSPETPED